MVELGRSEAPGRPFLYGTGFDFLERFGLTTLAELPPLDMDAAAQIEEARADQGAVVAEPPADPDPDADADLGPAGS